MCSYTVAKNKSISHCKYCAEIIIIHPIFGWMIILGFVTSLGRFLTEKYCEVRRVLLGYRPQRVCSFTNDLSFLCFSRQAAKNEFLRKLTILCGIALFYKKGLSISCKFSSFTICIAVSTDSLWWKWSGACASTPNTILLPTCEAISNSLRSG